VNFFFFLFTFMFCVGPVENLSRGPRAGALSALVSFRSGSRDTTQETTHKSAAASLNPC